MKEQIQTSLRNFAGGDLSACALNLFAMLGYNTERQAPFDEPTFAWLRENFFQPDTNFNEQRALVTEWRSVDLLFQLSASEVQSSLFSFDTRQVDETRIESYLFFALELTAQEYTRTALATITRELNRVFPMPCLVLFKYGGKVTLAVVNRRLHRRDESRDVLLKVTLIKDIDTLEPKRSHIEILQDLSFNELQRKHKFTNFVELHTAWQKTLDTKELNKRFFQEVANWYFWAVQNVTFPDGAEPNAEVRNATSVIRLLTRLIFVWFLQEKGLVSDKLFNERGLRDVLRGPDESAFYKAILQNLFFATLNSPMGERKFIGASHKGHNTQHFVHNVLRYQSAFVAPATALQELFAPVPFLNGGLFECLDKEENGQRTRVDGFSDHAKNALRVPDELFFGAEREIDLSAVYGDKKKAKTKVRGLINILDNYKFTIAENTPLEEEIALDPELLGKVFENLLANYNPETKTTARKQTGSFYTPREIVNYMVDESLIAYLKGKLQTETFGFQAINTRQPDFFGNEGRKQLAFEEPVSGNRWQGQDEALEKELRRLFDYNETGHEFNETETEILVKAIDECKILDPACGSGAFPMGVLHRLVFLLSKLDPRNAKWREWQKLKAIEETKAAYDIGDHHERENRLREINDIFDLNTSDYGRKLFLIENCIYGVDIQPIAIQIAKLRFFISLIVDQKTDPTQNNLGVRPLPNLETKFVAANTLIGLEHPGLKPNGMDDLEQQLKEVRAAHFMARTRRAKETYRKKDEQLRGAIAGLLKQGGINPTSADLIAAWNPYDQNTAAAWFDAEWMFGIEKGFDIVIGNPPYGAKFSKDEISYFTKKYKHQDYQLDSYLLFTEHGFSLAKVHGQVSYIIPNTWLINLRLKKIRKLIVNENQVLNISHYHRGVFDAVVDTEVVILKKAKSSGSLAKVRIIKENGEISEIFQSQDAWKKLEGEPINIFTDKNISSIASKIKAKGVPLSQICSIVVGMKPYQIGKGKPKQTPEIVKGRVFDATSKIDVTYKPVLRGSDIEKYLIKWNGARWIKFGEHLAEPRHSANFGATEKIVIRQTGDTLIATLDVKQFVCMNNMHVINVKEPVVNLRFILALLNSRCLDFYHEFLNPEKGEALAEIKKENIGKLPIPFATDAQQAALAGLVDYILFLKKLDETEKVNEYVPNSHLAEQFEEVIDALVYELYFEEDFRRAEIAFIKYALRDFPPLEGLSREEKIETIHAAYQKLRQKDNEIRNNLKLMDIRLEDLIMPIKTAR